MKPFKIKFADFTISSGSGYIFLSLDSNSKKRISKIYKLLAKKLEDLRDPRIPKEYKKRWKEFTKKEKELIKKKGVYHRFNPHVSIIKVEKEKTRKALGTLKKDQFRGKKFTAYEVWVTKTTGKAKPLFKKISKIKLK